VTLADRLAEDMKQAMRSKDKVRLSVLRLVKSAIKNAEIDKRITLGEEEIIGVLRKELKQRKESLLAIEGAGRDDLIAALNEEMQILETYLPQPLREEQIEQLVREAVQEVGAVSKADMGKVMPVVMKKIGGQAEGRIVNRIVQEVLSSL
jgi:uncharacterized protein YqeY